MNVLFLLLAVKSEPIRRNRNAISFVSALDLDSYEDLSSIEDRVRFRQDCMVGCMELFPYQFYCKYCCTSELDKEFERRQEKQTSTTTTSSTTTPLTTTTTTTTALPVSSTSTGEFENDVVTETHVTMASTSATVAETTLDVTNATVELLENDPPQHQCGISHALSISSITGREYSAASPISQLVENETDLVKKLELLISLEMTAIVVNGYTVKDPNRHPWIVALRTNGGSHFCGGAILDQTHILTAAHCKFVLEYDRVVYQTVHRANGHGEQILEVAQVINHPMAGRTPRGTWNYDFTVLVLAEPLPQFTKICLPSKDDDFTNHECILAGWGRVGTNPPHYAEFLQETSSTINGECGPYEQLLTPASFCVGYKGKSSGCNGDSGSPLVCKNNQGAFTLVGVASWAALSCAEETPTGFAKVTSVLDWINEILNEK